MITAEEFFRNKIKEQNPNREVITLSQELITAEQGMRWAHEFKQLHLHSVVGRSEQLSCETCIFNTHSWSEDYPCAACCGFDKHQAT